MPKYRFFYFSNDRSDEKFNHMAKIIEKNFNALQLQKRKIK